MKWTGGLMSKQDILDNLLQWKALLNLKGYGQYAKIKFNQGTDRFVRETLRRNNTLRIAVFSSNIIKNKLKAFDLATHLINVGISPESVKIVTMEQCIEAMWARPEAEFNKTTLFDKKTQLLMILDCYRVGPETNSVKVSQFREAFSNYCKSNPHINIILSSSDEDLTSRNCVFDFNIDSTKRYAFSIIQKKGE